jgi:acyl dehydratase
LAPSITIDAGMVAAYQSITGDSLRLALSTPESCQVTGHLERLVNPALVLQIAVGQSTVATRRVIANLFYRDVSLRRQVHLDDTLSTTVTPTALAMTRPGARGRRAKVLLQMSTVNQHGRIVAAFERLALLPCREPDALIEHGKIGDPDVDRPLDDYLQYVPDGWNLASLPLAHHVSVDGVTDPLRDTVSGSLELVRLTQNLAAAHRDPARGIDGLRLVYGGHAIGLAQASLSRMVAALATVIGWRSCDHLAPVFEGDVLEFHLTETDRLAVSRSAALVGYRVIARVCERPQLPTQALPTDVLDWRPVALVHQSASNGATS